MLFLCALYCTVVAFAKLHWENRTAQQARASRKPTKFLFFGSTNQIAVIARSARPRRDLHMTSVASPPPTICRFDTVDRSEFHLLGSNGRCYGQLYVNPTPRDRPSLSQIWRLWSWWLVFFFLFCFICFVLFLLTTKNLFILFLITYVFYFNYFIFIYFTVAIFIYFTAAIFT